jgi:hypothetical protein
MKEDQMIPIDLRSAHRVETDGTHTVTVEITGLPSIDAANRVSLWMRDNIRENAHKIGFLDREPPKMN